MRAFRLREIPGGSAVFFFSPRAQGLCVSSIAIERKSQPATLEEDDRLRRGRGAR